MPELILPHNKISQKIHDKGVSQEILNDTLQVINDYQVDLQIKDIDLESTDRLFSISGKENNIIKRWFSLLKSGLLKTFSIDMQASRLTGVNKITLNALKLELVPTTGMIEYDGSGLYYTDRNGIRYFLKGSTQVTPSATAEELNGSETFTVDNSSSSDISVVSIGTNNMIVLPFSLTADKSITWYFQDGNTDVIVRKYTGIHSTDFVDTTYSANNVINSFWDNTAQTWTNTVISSPEVPEPVVTDFSDIIVKHAFEAPITLTALSDTTYKMPRSCNYEGITFATNDLIFVYKNGEDLNGIYKYISGNENYIVWSHIANQNDLRTIRISEGSNRGVMMSMIENLSISYQFLHVNKSILHTISDAEAGVGQFYIQFPIQDGIQVFRNGIEEYNFTITQSTGNIVGKITFPNGLTSGELIKLKY